MKKYVVEYHYWEDDSCRFHSHQMADSLEQAIKQAAEEGTDQKHKTESRVWRFEASNYNDVTETTWSKETQEARKR